MKTLIIDNYDSFVYNLVQYVGELGGGPVVYRNNQITFNQMKTLKPDRIIISPGPGIPNDPRYFGICSRILRKMSTKIPTLGVCLGSQGIVHVYGGEIEKAEKLMHGKTSLIHHDGKGIFRGVKNPLRATRYHSLIAKKTSIPPCLKITARTIENYEVMGVRHTIYPIEGVQFHPESILTEYGLKMINNFLENR